MNITTNDFQELFFNNVEIDILEFNGDVVWEKDQSYGVKWNGAGAVLTRTGLARNFQNPVPFVNDGVMVAADCSSPFDTISPWKDMAISTQDGNSVVSIPKFYYKVTKSQSGELSIKISPTQLAGFHVSPAHRDRGDGEKSVVYIGRYHSNSDYQSKSGATPIAAITRAQGRAGTHLLGNNYWQLDFSMWVTIWMLYLVEFANWDSQAMIGYDCGNNSSKGNTGSTDTMPYHTGTMQASKTTYGIGVQYRYIEDPWGNVVDWCDGITFNQANIYCFEDPADYSDSYQSTGATLVGTRPISSNYIQDFGISAETGYEWFLYPSSVGSSQTNVPDYCHYDSAGVVLRVGGNYYQDANRGLFFLGGNGAASDASGGIGTRLMIIPNSTRSGLKATENFRKNPIDLTPSKELEEEEK